MADTETRLRAILDERIGVLDGAWGVLLQNRGLTEDDFRGERFRDHPRDLRGDPDLLNLTRPDIVESIHRDYFEAGCDITTTNTFTATSIGQADYGLEAAVYEMNVEGARLARRAADEYDGFVAGSIGPLNVALSLSPKVDDPAFRSATFDQVVESYSEQIRGLRRGRRRPAADRDDLRHAEREGSRSSRRRTSRPSCRSGSRSPPSTARAATSQGRRSDAFWLSIEHAKPLIVGVNCSLGATEMRPFLESLARVATTDVACHPNAGLPNAFGGYDEARARHEPPPEGVRRGRARQPRRRLLRHDPGAHEGDRRRRPRARAARAPGASAAPALLAASSPSRSGRTPVS